MHVFLHFGTYGFMVLQMILDSKLSELEQFEIFWDPTFFWVTLYIYTQMNIILTIFRIMQIEQWTMDIQIVLLAFWEYF